MQSIRELGPVRGSILAAWRLLRCNPFSHGGVDELSDRRLFRSTPTRSERHRRPAAAGKTAPASSRRIQRRRSDVELHRCSSKPTSCSR